MDGQVGLLRSITTELFAGDSRPIPRGPIDVWLYRTSTSDEGEPNRFSLEVAALTALFGLREAVVKATGHGPQMVNCPPNFFDLFVVNNPPHGVWVSALGDRDKLLVPAGEWLRALDAALNGLRLKLQREIPELVEDESFSRWVSDGDWPEFASELSRPGGI